MKIQVYDENYSMDRIDYPEELARFVVKNAMGKASEQDFLAAFDVIQEMDVSGGLVLSAIYATEMAAKNKRVDSFSNVTFFVDLDEDGEVDMNIDDIRDMFALLKKDMKGEPKLKEKMKGKFDKVKQKFADLAD